MHKTTVLVQLLRRDLFRYKRQFLGKLFDTALLLFTNLVVFGYFMAQYGLKSDYGPFLLIGAIASFGFFDTVGKIAHLLSDIEGDRTISYTLTLPLSSRMVFIYIGLYWALNSVMISVFLFPLGKLILFDQFDLSKISYVRLIPMFLAMNLFYGFFSLWLTSILKGTTGLDRIWLRVINPLLMFGTNFYSWYAVYAVAPVVAFMCLANPIVYSMEGMRAACLGQVGYLPFWMCLGVVALCTVACAWDGTRRLQRRLDCVT